MHKVTLVSQKQPRRSFKRRHRLRQTGESCSAATRVVCSANGESNIGKGWLPSQGHAGDVRAAVPPPQPLKAHCSSDGSGRPPLNLNLRAHHPNTGCLGLHLHIHVKSSRKAAPSGVLPFYRHDTGFHLISRCHASLTLGSGNSRSRGLTIRSLRLSSNLWISSQHSSGNRSNSNIPSDSNTRRVTRSSTGIQHLGATRVNQAGTAQTRTQTHHTRSRRHFTGSL